MIRTKTAVKFAARTAVCYIALVAIENVATRLVTR
jgi:hypothetical protein